MILDNDVRKDGNLMTVTKQRSKQQMVAIVWMSSSGEKRVALPVLVATLVSRPLGMLLK